MGKVLSKCVGARHDSIEKLNIEPAVNEDDAPSCSSASIIQVDTPVKQQQTEPDLLSRPLEHEYNMRHKERGMALIFNHERFDDKSLTKRLGTNVDCKNLDATFKQLGFDVRVFNDRTLLEIQKILGDYAAMNHSNEDCVVVAILSHGEAIPLEHTQSNEKSHTILAHDQLSYVYAKDVLYPIQLIYSYFTTENCPSLLNKPRLFFIQACQGEELDAGIKMIVKKQQKIEKDSIGFEMPKMKPVLPHTDFLIAYSTLPGFFSFRNSRHGSWFIRELCNELNKNGGINDLMKILTYVKQTIAYDYESQNAELEQFDGKKQIPCTVSMLTKLLYFPIAISPTDESPTC